MSHSTTLVVIRDAKSIEEAEEKLEDLLEPFNENTQVDPYEVECSPSEVESAVKFFRENPEHCKAPEGPELPYEEFLAQGKDEHEWIRQAVGGYSYSDTSRAVYSDGGYAVLSTYNPKSRWDWWTLGGRWHGFFYLKKQVSVGAEPLPDWRKMVAGDDRVNGLDQIETYTTQDALLGGAGTFGDDAGESFDGRADLARKRDIDFDLMRSTAAHEADLTYDKFEAATNGHSLPLSFKECRRRFFSDIGLDPEAWPVPMDRKDEYQRALDAARGFYHSQPWIEALREANLMSFFGDPVEDFCVHTGGRKRFVERASAQATTTFAVLLDGTWHERGQMGWWGVVSNEDDPDEWSRKQWELIKDLPDDTYLAVVDCHI